ncbi:MAG: alpha/beta hydrolase [Aquihabitans sp.]
MTTPALLHVVRTPGTGLQVVFVHGGLDRSSSFGRVARQLDDLPVVRYDRRGYGGSRDLPVGSLAAHIADLVDVVDGRDSVVFGHSMGGVIALGAAELRPDLFRAAIAYEAPTPWQPWWPSSTREPGDPADDAERFMRQMVGDRIWERLPERTRRDRRAEGTALRADFDSLKRASAPWSLATLAVPVISAAGSKSTWWHQRGAEEIADEARFATFTLVDGASHGIHLTHPKAAAALVRQALVESAARD